MSLKILALSAAALLSLAGASSAAEGITKESVKFAQVAALDGPAAALGTGMQLGLRAAFEEANRAGGVYGRLLTLDSVDDGYEPDRSAKEVQQIIDADDHLGLVGAVGTPTAAVTQPLATASDIPYIGAFTGAGFLRDGGLGNVLNIRASYDAETEAWIKYLVDDKGFKKIAILYQDDGFGRVGLDGVTKALERRGMTLAATGSYTRNTVAVKSALLDIRKAKPDTVVMVGAYKPIAEFIKLSRKLKFTPEFVNISFVGSTALANELGPEGEGVIISQVVPFPWDASVPVVAAYQAALTAVDASANPDFISLEGYLAGRLVIEILNRTGENLSRKAFLATMLDLGTVDFGGAEMTFGPGDNQGMDSVFLTSMKADDTFEPL
ncbi:MAG: ABC transporter substrate-binding protein [Rhodobacterales bacterium]